MAVPEGAVTGVVRKIVGPESSRGRAIVDICSPIECSESRVDMV